MDPNTKIVITEAYYLIDKSAVLSTTFKENLTRRLTELNGEVCRYLAPLSFELDGDQADNNVIQEALNSIDEERIREIREKDAPSVSFETREIATYDGRRSAPILYVFLDYSKISKSECRKRLIERLTLVRKKCAGIVVIAVSDKDVDFDDSQEIRSIARDFKPVYADAWVRILSISVRRRARGLIVRPEQLIDEISLVIAEDAIYKRANSRTLSLEPGCSFSFEVFAARSLAYERDEIERAILPLYREEIVKELQKKEGLAVKQIPILKTKDLVEKSPFSLKHSLDGEIKTRDGRCELTPPDRWFLSKSIPPSRRQTVVDVLERRSEEMASDVKALEERAAKRVNSYRSEILQSLADFGIKSAVTTNSSRRLVESFENLRSYLASRCEATATTVDKGSEASETAYACVAEMERVPRFSQTLVFASFFATWCVDCLILFRLRMMAAVLFLCCLSCFCLWIVRRYRWKKRYQEAFQYDLSKMREKWVDAAVKSMKSLITALNDDIAKRIVSLEKLAVNIQKVVSESAVKNTETTLSNNTTLISNDRLPELWRHMKQSRDLARKDDLKEFAITVLQGASGVACGKRQTTDLSGIIDDYARAKLVQCFQELSLDFFLRDDYATDEVNLDRFQKMITPCLSDVYARGALVNEVFCGNSEDLRWRSRAYILAPKGLTSMFGRLTASFNIVETGWKTMIVGMKLIELYGGDSEIDDYQVEKAEENSEPVSV